jgi:hypothetical protein
LRGNSAVQGGLGGGISNGSFKTPGTVVTVSNSTISGNSAQDGGGIFSEYGFVSIVNNGGTVTSHGYNLSSDNGGGYLNGPGDQINTDPLLGPLQNNGGPTLTHAPLTGSPAIDAGDPNFTPPPFRDQRGPCFDRVFGRRIDVGSVEVQPQPRCPTPAPRPTPH